MTKISSTSTNQRMHTRFRLTALCAVIACGGIGSWTHTALASAATPPQMAGMPVPPPGGFPAGPNGQPAQEPAAPNQTRKAMTDMLRDVICNRTYPYWCNAFHDEFYKPCPFVISSAP